jgi:methylenetetrahydrofolate dehydrogenase (NADP+) / methenyltetrahydrofolate cyclohydrolase
MKIDGRKIAQNILDNLGKQVEELKKKNIIPHLAIILVGDNSASITYVNQKKIKAEQIGAKTTIVRLPNNISEDDLIQTIKQFNQDETIHGIIVQQPLPQNINTEIITQAIDPKKDVDGFNLNSQFEMPITMAVLKILKEVHAYTSRAQLQFIEWLKNKEIVIIGKGETGGKPIIKMFVKMKIPFTLIDSKTENPEKLTKKADIIISAVGKSNTIKPQKIKKGVVLIGIGISRGKSAKLMGDYDQNKIENIASFYTPTPGGIGPINVIMLLKNLIKSAEELSC